MDTKSVILDESQLNGMFSEKASLQKIVYDTLVGKFMNKELVPGQIINRRQLAAEMNVSVAPVLEALVILEQEGYVTTIPRKGTIVSPAKDSSIAGQLIVREALEVEAATLYCGEKIRENYEILRAYASNMDATDVFSTEHAQMEIIFHSSLVNLAGVDSLLFEYIRANRLGFFYKINSMRDVERTQSQKHVDLVDALCTDDIDKAAKAIRSHLRSGKPFKSGIYEGFI